MYALTDYNYFLPENLIAQEPVSQRDQSRLLHLEKTSGKISHYQFSSLTDHLKKGDVLVVNNTEVIPARMFGRKETGGKIEILIVNYAAAAKKIKAGGKIEFECLVKASKSPKPGTCIDFGPDLKATVSAVHERTFTLEFFTAQPFDEVMNNNGVMPLPPYIKREQANDPKWNDRTSYQTVYAQHKGAVAAPTAGLHFSVEMLEYIKDMGVSIANITLHVGYGTFMPIRCSDIRDHQMHSEHFTISENTAKIINAAKTDGRRVVAVGTTSVRTLEYLADKKGHVHPSTGNCDLFIYPGYAFKCVDAMITNFHLPQSTLIMLVSAFAGRKNILNAYDCAVQEKYRFFSYGDAMFIE
ncbi:MAG: tRNA preQ1(34) S-adenosylmethionine ribosyltransferase-isomerase QueA [Desulfobacteraceae bacterium]|nr:tRNA preQ1(34) S-adenosylmethionine ribosyltransferase-isomerase QueA [Desulfobacteraceae bacterium]